MKILPYKNGSRSAKALADALGCKQLRQEGSRWKARQGDVVINWGSSNVNHPVFQSNAIILNRPEAIAKAANKLVAFTYLIQAGVDVPDCTQSRDNATRWIKDGCIVVCRTILNGHSGAGIVIATKEDELVDAPLYTKYIKKEQEYRLHVLREGTFFSQRKARKREVPDDQVNWQVRNHQNGFIYANKDIEIHNKWNELATNAVKALGLDFGAVDLIVNKAGVAMVLEVNTACGLEGATLEAYTKVFKEYQYE